jgi:hypothetical protein
MKKVKRVHCLICSMVLPLAGVAAGQVVIQRYDPNGVPIDTNGSAPGTALVLPANVAQINVDVAGWISSGGIEFPEVVQIRFDGPASSATSIIPTIKLEGQAFGAFAIIVADESVMSMPFGISEQSRNRAG